MTKVKFDSFRVSAVFNDGATVDNDIVRAVTQDALDRELEEARAWFKDRNPVGYMVEYIHDGKIVDDEMIEA